jgi:rsbT co-antagonist protein RsbR
MEGETASPIPAVLKKHEQDLLNQWVKNQLAAVSRRADLISEPDLRRESAEFLGALRDACQNGCTVKLNAPNWRSVREILESLSRSRSRLGFTPTETATFVFSFKQPLNERLRAELAEDPAASARETWAASLMLDDLGLFTTEVHQKTREEVIRRQQQELLELSTPVVRLWDGVLALPLIGTLDSARTQVVMESLLKQIVDTGS